MKAKLALGRLCSCLNIAASSTDSIREPPRRLSQSSNQSPEATPEQTLLITAGSCLVTSDGCRCPCVAGINKTTDPSVSTHLCSLCGHPLKEHNSYGLTNTPLTTMEQGFSMRDHPEITPREKTVEKLADLIEECFVVHVRGTPSSGKSVLARLLAAYYKKQEKRIVFLNGWHSITDCTEHLVRSCRSQGYPTINAANLVHTDILFIVDEAQQSYRDPDFWLHIVKARSGDISGTKFCLFTSYGSPNNGLDRYKLPPGSTPVRFGGPQRVSITTPIFMPNDHPSLFYDQDEFHDVIHRLCSNPIRNLPLDKEAIAYIFSISNGHPAATTALVRLLFKANRSALKTGAISLVTKAMVVSLLADEPAVFSALSQYGVARSFVHLSALAKDIEAMRALRHVLNFGSVPLDLEDSGIRRCYEEGWLHAEPTSFDGEDVFCVFPSMLHRKFVESHIDVEHKSPFPVEAFPNIKALCLEIIPKMSRSSLLRCVDKRLGTSGRPHPPEAQFQDEFYRVLTTVLSRGVTVSSEWSYDKQGRIDFRIVDPGWGIELLRDGDRLAEHCERFLPGGTLPLDLGRSSEGMDNTRLSTLTPEKVLINPH